MLRTSALMIALVLAPATSARAQLPPQPAPPASPLGGATEAEKAACHPDVVKFCAAQLKANENDVFGILGCLQTNRSRISAACNHVLTSHGQ